MTGSRLLERLVQGPVLCAEGYLFELERRGYLQAGAYVPEVVLEHPHLVEQLHREFVHAGSDVVEAFTYYGHREKLRLIGKEDLLEPLNRGALAIAGRVAGETGALLAGNVCNTNLYLERRGVAPRGPRDVRRAGGVGRRRGRRLRDRRDVPVRRRGAAGARGDPGGRASTPSSRSRSTATRARARAGRRRRRAGGSRTRAPRSSGSTASAARRRCCRCSRRCARRSTSRSPRCRCPTARTRPSRRSSRSAAAARSRSRSTRSPARRYEVAEFARAALGLGVAYLGLCCGAAPHHIRAMAEAMGRRPPASRYSPDMSKHAYLGSDPSLQAENLAFAERL